MPRFAMLSLLHTALASLGHAAALPSNHEVPAPNHQQPPHHSPPARIIRLYTAHAILACLAWALIFPLGGILIRLCTFRHLLWIHAGLQLFGLTIYTAALGLGLELSLNPQHWRLNNKHVIIGLTIYVVFWVQACSGWLHHVWFKRYMSRSAWSYLHLWVGRCGVTLGIVNAGFGFQITGKGWGSWQVVVYTICAVVVWVGFVGAAIVGEVKRKRNDNGTGRGGVVEVIGVPLASQSSDEAVPEKMG